MPGGSACLHPDTTPDGEVEFDVFEDEFLFARLSDALIEFLALPRLLRHIGSVSSQAVQVIVRLP